MELRAESDDDDTRTFVVEGNYGQGWEALTYEEGKDAALQTLQDYQDNDFDARGLRIRKVVK